MTLEELLSAPTVKEQGRWTRDKEGPSIFLTSEHSDELIITPVEERAFIFCPLMNGTQQIVKTDTPEGQKRAWEIVVNWVLNGEING